MSGLLRSRVAKIHRWTNIGNHSTSETLRLLRLDPPSVQKPFLPEQLLELNKVEGRSVSRPALRCALPGLLNRGKSAHLFTEAGTPLSLTLFLLAPRE